MAEGFTEPPSTLPSTPMDPVSVEVDDNSQDEEDSVPFLEVEVGILFNVQILKGIPFPCISSLSLSPSLNLFANNVTLSSLDWVEGLKNLTISSRLTVSTLPIPTASLEESPLPADPDPIISDVNSPLSPTDLSNYGYFL